MMAFIWTARSCWRTALQQWMLNSLHIKYRVRHQYSNENILCWIRVMILQAKIKLVTYLSAYRKMRKYIICRVSNSVFKAKFTLLIQDQKVVSADMFLTHALNNLNLLMQLSLVENMILVIKLKIWKPWSTLCGFEKTKDGHEIPDMNSRTD